MIVKLKEGLYLEVSGISSIESKDLHDTGSYYMVVTYVDKNKYPTKYIPCDSKEESIEL